MITETQTRVVVLQLTDELLAQLQPFMVGLDIAATSHNEWAEQKAYEHGQFALYEQVEQRLTMRGEVYAALAERVGSGTTATLAVEWLTDHALLAGLQAFLDEDYAGALTIAAAPAFIALLRPGDQSEDPDLQRLRQMPANSR